MLVRDFLRQCADGLPNLPFLNIANEVDLFPRCRTVRVNRSPLVSPPSTQSARPQSSEANTDRTDMSALHSPEPIADAAYPVGRLHFDPQSMALKPICSSTRNFVSDLKFRHKPWSDNRKNFSEIMGNPS